MKSKLTLKKLYECTYGEVKPFDDKQQAGTFVFTSIVADILEKELVNKNAVSMWDIYMFLLYKLGFNCDEIHTCLNKILEKENIDAILYHMYSQDELFDHCWEYTDHILQKLGVDFNKVVNGECLYRTSLMPLLFSQSVLTNILKQKYNGKGDFEKTPQGKAIKQLISAIFSTKDKADIVNFAQKFVAEQKICRQDIQNFRKTLLADVNLQLLFDLKECIESEDKEEQEDKIDFSPIKPKTERQNVSKNDKIEAKPTLQEVTNISERVIGQEFAIAKIKNNILSASVGFRDETQPIASFLLTGPTGVGKTETAKAVADACFGGKIHVVDMSTFKNDIDVSRLLGGSPNYVGYNDPNAFCNFLKENPNSVILFDEIEKGHSSCLDLLMRILDEGEFINSKGEVISLKGTVIFCTTNLTQNKSKTVGFNKDDVLVEHEVTGSMGLKKELAGRFTEIIEYKQLTKDNCKRIAKEIFLKSVIEKFEKNNENGLKIAYTDDFLDKIIENANTNLFGARDIKKSIKQCLIAPVSTYILENNPKNTTIFISAQGIKEIGGKSTECEFAFENSKKAKEQHNK